MDNIERFLNLKASDLEDFALSIKSNIIATIEIIEEDEEKLKEIESYEYKSDFDKREILFLKKNIKRHKNRLQAFEDTFEIIFK